MLWTEEQVSELARRWEQKESARYISGKMGISRNAVLGKIHRLGLSVRVNRSPINRVEHVGARRNGGGIKAAMKAARAREQKVAERANQSSIIINTVLARARAMGELPECEAVELPKERANGRVVALLDLEPRHCRWPIERDGTTMFCGSYKAMGAYCQRHANIAYRPFVKRRMSDEERARRRRLAAVKWRPMAERC